MEPKSKTVCAQLTPHGRGAVAVVGISGPSAESSLDACFQPAGGNSLTKLNHRSVIYGIWNSTGEDLIVYRRGNEHFEVHCHGGTTASAAVIVSLAKHGVEEVPPAQLEESFADEWEVSTRLALAATTTNRTAKILLVQTKLFPEKVREIQSLIDTNQTALALAEIEDLLKWADFGIHLTVPRTVVLCGHPNVGKSSLINAIVGFQRAIVHDQPGTTRDVVSQRTAIDGWPVELKDTAGLRIATNTIEAIGVEKAREQIENADVKICVFDSSSHWNSEDQKLLELVEPQLTVFNKCDLTDSQAFEDPKALQTSAATGQGIEELIARVGKLLVENVPGESQAFPVSNEQRKRLVDLRDSLQS